MTTRSRDLRYSGQVQVTLTGNQAFLIPGQASLGNDLDLK